MGKRLTNEEFLEKLWEKNEHYRNGEFEVIGDFERKLARHQSNENIYYKTGNLQTLLLEIRNGFCMQACPIYEFRD